MFTGIVEELGAVVSIDARVVPGVGESAVLRVEGPLVAADACAGASIAVNGVCLTVIDHDQRGFAVDVMAETLRRSSLGGLMPGSRVNLERAMPASGRFGGHVVQGHVDGITTISARTPGDRWEVVRFGLPASLARYVVEKGSIAVDGVSLTVSAIGGGSGNEPDWFEVSLIPTTLGLTTLGIKGVGDAVNLEVDVIAKYVERMLASDANLAGAAAGIPTPEAVLGGRSRT